MKILGSQSFESIKWRDMWGFVVQKRGKVYAEGHHKSPNLDTWGEALTLSATFTLQPKDESQCNWKDTELNGRRKEFCNKYEGYGSVCSCECELNTYILLVHLDERVVLLYILMSRVFWRAHSTTQNTKDE